MVPRTVLTRSGPISVNTARPVNTVQLRTLLKNTGPMKNVINNAYSTARRPFNKITTANNSNFTKKVNTVKGTRVNTARPKAVLSAVKGNKGNAVKASACWVWRPKHKVLDHVSRNNGASMSFKRFDYIDAQFQSKSSNGLAPKRNIFLPLMCRNVVPQESYVSLCKSTPDESNFVIGGLDQFNFKTMNKLKEKPEERRMTKDPGMKVEIKLKGKDKVNVVDLKTSIKLPNDPNMPELEDIVYSDDDKMFEEPKKEQEGRKRHYDKEQSKMDVKSVFIYGKIEEEVYVCQPPGFEDPDFPDRVYKVEKALYGLHQAPKAWYETLSTYLLDNRFQRGNIDKTLFIRRDKGDILLVQVYVDDIIFGSTKKLVCTEFEKMMLKKFQMSSIGELTFFFGLQVKQKEDGTFISKDKYVTEILKKFGYTDFKTASTPMETQKALLKDEDGKEVDVHLYRSMIGSLMYLTSSRPDIMFAVCACARYQVNPKVSHLHAVKRIFRYLKGQPKLSLWYPKDSPFDLVAYTNSDYARASLDRKSTIGGCQFLGCRLISWQCKKQIVVANSTIEAEYVAASSCCGQVLWIQNQLLDYGDSNEKKLIQMIKIHTDKNVAYLLTKAFDNGIGVNAGDSKLMLLGINLLLLGKVNDARHKLTAARES
ncbi:uncharacterized mitochondrial protein-like protein [Tanacetum coccineum]|uniref:Uncharacterized mitochondrial protein-like protein n=1 Tax=Tanacetum coccineum TaxID=301880 RepID=A0ABQ5JAK1_9ASTR